MKPLHIKEFPDDLKIDLRKLALDKGIPFYQMVINVLRDYVKANK
jgi:hypothetical protein